MSLTELSRAEIDYLRDHNPYEKRPTPAWKIRGFVNIASNCYSNALLVAIFNLPGMDKTLFNTVNRKPTKFNFLLYRMCIEPDNRELERLSRIMSPKVCALTRGSREDDNYQQDIMDMLHAIFVDKDGTNLHRAFFNLTIINASGGEDESLCFVAPLFDFDAYLCSPATTNQDSYCVKRFAPFVIVSEVGKRERFACSKAPFRFPIWRDPPKHYSDPIPFPDAWSSWYQLVAVIEGGDVLDGHYTSTVQTASAWTKYDDDIVDNTARTSPNNTVPRALIFCRVRLSPARKLECFVYCRKRMKAAMEIYNALPSPPAEKVQYSKTGEKFKASDNEPPRFDEEGWNIRFDRIYRKLLDDVQMKT